ncbi:hypothetical protein MIND_01096900 [Mycena indigotica]|uniref:Cytochrome P450 n=1 Tax=Mycena indigotica TaxID=2126181 RepID=A0A8H6W149_9AGAR|nr:uncharacterized protein MIND_01096900 [Mycena indigotica]KAF7295569.1 hypothetical protein MIND_01096900 [Mycena indigotica]
MERVFFPALALGIATHVVYNRYEPNSANTVIPVLFALPPALVSLLNLPLSIANLSSSYFTFLTSLSLSIVIYRLSPFHPLAQYPGPVLCKITELWTVWVAYTGYQHRYFKKLHDHYGPFVRTGPNELSIIEPQTVSQILGVGGLDKGRYTDATQPPDAPRTVVTIWGEGHTAKRRVWNRAMTSASQRNYDPFLIRRARQLMSHLSTAADDAVDMVFWFELFSLDLMGDLSFGGPFESMHQGKDQDSLGERIHTFTWIFSITGKIPWILPTLNLLPQVAKITREANEYGRTLAIRRMKNGPGDAGSKDLFYHLADEAGVENQRPTVEETAADGIVAIIAASDTTTSAMSSLVYFLLKHPKTFKLVLEELDRVFPDGDDEEALCDFAKHQQLEYLTACINETLRLHPPLLSNGVPRELLEGQPERIFGGLLIDATLSLNVHQDNTSGHYRLYAELLNAAQPRPLLPTR